MSSTPQTPVSPAWRARPVSGSRPGPTKLSPAKIDEHWRPLGQSWRPAGPEPGFHAGWARISWEKTALHYDAIFLADQPRNRARSLNEYTWELGDVCEVFLQVTGRPEYLELHVTPENQRLQLRWSPDGLERMRRNEVPLEDFMVRDENWVRSATHIGPGYWVAQVNLPAKCLGLDSFAPDSSLATAVCRYDYGPNPVPFLSSTAPLTAPSYHRRQEWPQLVLAP